MPLFQIISCQEVLFQSLVSGEVDHIRFNKWLGNTWHQVQ